MFHGFVMQIIEMRVATRMGMATVAFAVIHSVLASRSAKRMAARFVGERRRDAGYRLFFVGQSLLAFPLLIAYGARLPKRTIYRINGPSAILLRIGQAAGVLHLLAAARHVGIARLAGLENLRAWRNNRPVPPGPVAQGPEMQADGRLSIGGPYLWSRHPLNFSAIPLFWSTPHMTTRRLAFNLASTLYFVLGSVHEEVRLNDAYGNDYRAYAEGPVPFFWPWRAGRRAFCKQETAPNPLRPLRNI
jgi:protein-S-isoprenylcysteine O-methyltransferase Ste14